MDMPYSIQNENCSRNGSRWRRAEDLRSMRVHMRFDGNPNGRGSRGRSGRTGWCSSAGASTHGTDDSIFVLASSPSGHRLLAGSLAGEAVLPDQAPLATIEKLTNHPLVTLGAACSSDGTRIAGDAAGQDGAVRVCTAEGSPLGTATGKGWAARLQWSPRRNVLTAVIGRQVHVLDMRTYTDLPSPVTDLVWSIDGCRLGVAPVWRRALSEPGDDRFDPAKTFAWKGSILRLPSPCSSGWPTGVRVPVAPPHGPRRRPARATVRGTCVCDGAQARREGHDDGGYPDP